MLVYLGLISIAFGLVVWAVMNITGTYLINQRVSEEMQAADDLALEVTPYVKRTPIRCIRCWCSAGAKTVRAF